MTVEDIQLVQKDPEFQKLSPEGQADIIRQLQPDDLPGSVSIQPIGVPEARKSDRPILDDLAAGGDALLGNMPMDGENGPIGSLVDSVQSGARSANSKVQDLLSSGLMGPSIGGIPTDIAAMGVDAVSNLPNLSYRDVGTGLAEGAGAVLFGGAGSAAGPLGTLAGGTVGSAAGRTAADQLFANIDGVEAPPPLESMGAGALDYGLGRLMPGGADPKQIALAKEGIERNAYENAFDNLTMLFSKSPEEAKNVIAGLEMGATDGGSMATVRNSLKELAETYGFKFDSLPTVVKQLVKRAGNGHDIEGEIAPLLNTAAKALDSELPKVRFSDPAETGSSLYGAIDETISDYLSKPDVAFSKDAAQIRKLANEAIERLKSEAVKEGVPERLAANQASYAEKSAELAKLKKKLPKIGKEQIKGELSPTYQKAQTEIIQLESEIDDLTKNIASDQMNVMNPEVGFETLWSMRRSLDRDAANAFDAERPNLNSEIYKLIGDGLRTFEDGRAQVSRSPVGQSFSVLKREYELLRDLEPRVNKMAKAVLDDPDNGKNWKLPNVFVRSSNGNTKFVMSDAVANLLPTYNTSKGREVAKALSAAGAAIRTKGVIQPTIGSQALSGIANAATVGARQVLPASMTRDVISYNENDAKLEELGQGMLFETLLDKGLITPEERKNGVNMGIVAQRNPQAFVMAQQEASQPLQALKDAFEFGDEEEKGMALTNTIKMFPKLFPTPKSGIKGEVEINGVIKLYDPIDRARYSEMVERNPKLRPTQKAKITTVLNHTHEVRLE